MLGMRSADGETKPILSLEYKISWLAKWSTVGTCDLTRSCAGAADILTYVNVGQLKARLL